VQAIIVLFDRNSIYNNVGCNKHLFVCFYIVFLYINFYKQIVQPIKKPVRTLSIFKSMAFVKDAKGISFKNRLKGHINWRKVRNFNVI
jgi:hypothetical protein